MATPFSSTAQLAFAVLVKPSTGAVTNYKGGDDEDNGAALVAALDAADIDDRILLSVGVFDLGAGTISVPAGVTLCGTGKYLTRIRSSNDSPSTETPTAIVGLSDGCTVERLSIDSTNPSFLSGNLDYPIGHGGYSGGDLFATLRALRVMGKSDGLFFSNSGSATIRIVAYDCDFSTEYDALVFNGGVGSSLLLYSVNAIADGPGGGFLGVNAFRGFGTTGSVFWFGGSAFARTTSANDAAALQLVSSVRARLWGVKLASSTADTGLAHDVSAFNAGIIAEFHGVSYSPAKIDIPGNITILSDPVLAPTTYTIASGAISVDLPNQMNYRLVDTGGGDADLDTINGGRPGQVLILKAAFSDRTVTLKDGTSLKLDGDFALDNIEDSIGLIAYSNTVWHELFRSNNGA
jgi:hypothetical protein